MIRFIPKNFCIVGVVACYKQEEKQNFKIDFPETCYLCFLSLLLLLYAANSNFLFYKYTSKEETGKNWILFYFLICLELLYWDFFSLNDTV